MIADLKARADRLRELHHASEMLVLPNVWDGPRCLLRTRSRYSPAGR
jgi:2-methylisocitrate lyase-like PEP mutase family enzyme